MGKRKATEEYKEELKSKNINIECLEEYINNATKILHKCLICGNEWKTRPNDILKGHNCPACSKKKQKTTEEYKEDLKSKNIKIEPLEEYINSSTKILHKCLICGNTWKAIPNNILSGYGCSKCATFKRTKTTEEYKEELKSKNINIECLEEYKGALTKIFHKCLICNYEWKIKPNTVLNGYGCPACYGNKRKTTEEYKEELKSKNINIECLEEYKGANVKILHKCLTCNYKWRVTPIHILKGNCPVCSKKKQKTTEEYKEELKSKNINIECLEEYINSYTKILHKCKKCGNEWKAIPSSILRGSNCPYCNFSHGEKTIENFLIENKIQFNSQKKFADCRDKLPLSFDFYLPELNIAIEYQGRQHYEAIEHFGGEKRLHLQRHHDWLKRKYCKDNNIILITISYKEDVENVLKTYLTKS